MATTKEKKPETTLDGIPAHLCKLRREVSDLEREHESDKAQAAASKKLLENKQREFFTAFDDTLNPKPLFDAADADWRDVPLSEAIGGHEGVTVSLLGKLGEAELKTVGELADYLNADGGRMRLTSIKGVGEAKAEAIEQGLEEFWARRAEMAPVDENGEATEGEGDE